MKPLKALPEEIGFYPAFILIFNRSIDKAEDLSIG
jgi:hypothetical protein